jgi:hypothetical protein
MLLKIDRVPLRRLTLPIVLASLALPSIARADLADELEDLVG